jgi:hypothetical protein
MQTYKVVVRVRKVDDMPKAVYEEAIFSVYSKSAEDAVSSVVQQKKVDKKDVVSVQYDRQY